MVDLVAVAFVAAVAIQLPIGILVYVDARRLGLRNPELYSLGILLPAGGFVVIPYYLSQRKTFPKADAEEP